MRTVPESNAAGPGQPQDYTDSHVEISGAFAADLSHYITVNGILVKLSLAEFLFVFLLACHSRTQAELSSPVILKGGMFLKTSRIVDQIELLKRTEPGLHFHPRTPDEPWVHQAKFELLASLRKFGINPNLIQAVPGAGYRLTPRPEHLTIVLIDEDDGNMTWV